MRSIGADVAGDVDDASAHFRLVKTQARNQALTKIADNEYTISVHAPPIKGKANDAVIQILAKHFAVPQSCVKIIRGQSARKKLIQIG